MKFQTVLIYFFLPLSLSLAEDITPIIDRIELIERNLSTLQKQYYSKSNVSTPGKLAAGTATSYESRISNMEIQLRAIRGDIEELSHDNKITIEKFDKLAEDMEFRFAELRGTPATTPTAQASDVRENHQNIDVDPLDEVIEQSSELERPKPKSLIRDDTVGSLGTVKVDLVQQEVQAAKKAALDQQTKLAVKEKTDAENKAKSQAEFDRAFDAFRQSKFTEAQDKFKQFIAANGNHKLVGSAYYWLGESFLQTANNDKAAFNFIQSYKKFPTGAKAPNSLFKLAVTLNKMNKKPESCTMFAQFEEKFSATTPANLVQKVREEASKVKCK